MGFSKWIVELGYDSQCVPRHDIIDLALRTNDIEMYVEHFKEGSIPICLVGTSATFQISLRRGECENP